MVFEKGEEVGQRLGHTISMSFLLLFPHGKKDLAEEVRTLFSHSAGSSVPCLHTWLQPSCPEDREESKLQPSSGGETLIPGEPRE